MTTATATKIKSAVKSGEPTEAEGTFLLPISAIAANDNPRHEPSNIFNNEGYVLIGIPPNFDPEQWDLQEGQEHPPCLRDMALSADIDEVRQFVEMIETHESVNRNQTPDAPESIVELSQQLRNWASVNPNGIGQFVPAYVKKVGKNWVLIDGGRRTTATLYLHAKDRLAIADKEKDAPKQAYSPVILCMDATNVPDDQFFELSMMLNMARKQMTPLQEGLVYKNLLETPDPKSGKKPTLKELHKQYGQMLGVTYNTMRNRVALWREYTPAVRDEKTGKVKKAAKGLTEGDRKKVATGEMGATAASRKSLGERHKTDRPAPEAGQPRRRSLPLSEIESEFDRNRTDDDSNNEFLRGLAYCMGVTPKQAIKESDKRIKQAADAEEAKAA